LYPVNEFFEAAYVGQVDDPACSRRKPFLLRFNMDSISNLRKGEGNMTSVPEDPRLFFLSSLAGKTFALYVFDGPVHSTTTFADHALGLHTSGTHRVRQQVGGRVAEGRSDLGAVHLIPAHLTLTVDASALFDYATTARELKRHTSEGFAVLLFFMASGIRRKWAKLRQMHF
jgi:hypothetical protein